MLLYIIPVALIVRWLDLYEREPRSLVIGAVVWGAAIATLFSGVGNLLWGSVIARVAGPEFASEWGPALTAPPVEETYKALGVIVLYLVARTELDDLMDGFVLGAMVGLGFTVAEDIDYFLTVFGGSTSGVLEGFWVRVIASGLYGHVLYTGLSGIGIAYFVTRRADASFGRRLSVGLALLALAVIAHFIWNSPFLWEELPLLAATALKGLPFLIVLGLVLRLARRREHRWLVSGLEPEVGRPGLLREELEVLCDPAHRRGVTRSVARLAGPDAARLVKQLHREQINLSMLATRHDRPNHPELVRQRQLCRSLRDRLWAMPGAAGGLALTTAMVDAARTLPEELLWEPTVQTTPPGLAWWTVPDGTQPATGRVDAGVPLMIVARAGEWAQVRAINGWTGWVDGRLFTLVLRTFWR